ncbi:hypothetical protein IL992_44035 [Microbispora sp. NEAU-D428]|uniref:hypothetical protein n=1 Tax=Microbispora sitophila TaxID=2771537 RepID=UPI001867C34B|nr:hypothetical protein [Microbispora sitophila]MBE3016071.1 hypothetical protein [Microbispora sitophila]
MTTGPNGRHLDVHERLAEIHSRYGPDHLVSRPSRRLRRAFLCVLGLVVAGGVDDQIAEKFFGGGGDDPDVEIVDEKDDVGSGVGSFDAAGRSGSGHPAR